MRYNKVMAYIFCIFAVNFGIRNEKNRSAMPVVGLLPMDEGTRQ